MAEAGANGNSSGRNGNEPGALDFAAWRSSLPAPLSPIVMRGFPLDRLPRVRAGLDGRFIDELERYIP